MNTLDDISHSIFSEFINYGKTVAVHAEGNILIIKIGTNESRIMNWESTARSTILDIARGLVLRENYKGNALLLG
jgi:hypothetical protein